MLSVVVAEKLRKLYSSGVVGVEEVSFTAGRGEILCLLGLNGAGKTTTIGLPP